MVVDSGLDGSERRAGVATGTSYIGLSHFDLAITTNSNGNIYGVLRGRWCYLSPGAHDFMQLNNDPTPSNMLRNPGILGSGAPYVYWAFYGFVADRFGLEMGVEPGEDNLDYRKFNYRIESGYFLANTDANFWRLSVESGYAEQRHDPRRGHVDGWRTTASGHWSRRTRYRGFRRPARAARRCRR